MVGTDTSDAPGHILPSVVPQPGPTHISPGGTWAVRCPNCPLPRPPPWWPGSSPEGRVRGVKVSSRPPLLPGSLLYQFPVAAVTEHCHLGALKQPAFILTFLEAGVQIPESVGPCGRPCQCPQGPASPEPLRVLPASSGSGGCWWPLGSSLCPHLHMPSPVWERPSASRFQGPCGGSEGPGMLWGHVLISEP